MKAQNQYTEQANQFLTRNGIKFRATLSDSKTPAWKAGGEKSGHHYRVTLSSNHVTGPNHARRITFDFWGSIADAEKGQTEVSTYDVLACISGDVNCPDTFKDFCAEYGDNEDSIKALQTFRRCNSFSKRLRAFFTQAEIEQLSEIN
jgi:hypothetical protein